MGGIRIERITFSVKMVYKRVRVWTSEQFFAFLGIK